MQITIEIQESIDQSVLCWLATVDQEQQANVSPKEIFCSHQDHLLIANIASPQSEKNISTNPKVAVSFVNILSQKGFQLKGVAEIINDTQKDYHEYLAPIEAMTAGKYPVKNIFKIKLSSHKKILAPSYFFYPKITESEKIQQAKEQYNL